MKLLRFGPLGMEKPGILDADDNIRDLTGIINDVSGPELGDETLARLREVGRGLQGEAQVASRLRGAVKRLRRRASYWPMRPGDGGAGGR